MGPREAWAAAGAVLDPELPVLSLADLGVLREVEVDEAGRVVVVLTPTYTGCPAVATMREDLQRTLLSAGASEVEVHLRLAPPWSTDDITPRGRETLRAHGISPPGPTAYDGPVAVSLLPTRRVVACPRCGERPAELVSEFGPTACTALYRCPACAEPFEHVKEI